MPAWSEFGKMMLAVGVGRVILGGVAMLSPKLPFGRLPGDLLVEKKNVSFAFPITTCILISLVLTAIGWLIARWRS